MGIKIETSGFDDFGEHLKRDVAKMVDDTLSAAELAAKAMVCKEHGKRVTVTREPTREGVALEFKGCCDDLEKRAKAAAERRLD